MQFVSGDRVRLTKRSPIGDNPGPSIGAVGTVIGLEVTEARDAPQIWRVAFDDFGGRFHVICPIGLWFVWATEIELLAATHPWVH